ncbi:MAG: glycoside hydrolase family 92 protein [Mucilaginibacter sp.]|nr:glycoside hydrolase family 92 protein [Mucilaginibacter sp.]
MTNSKQAVFVASPGEKYFAMLIVEALSFAVTLLKMQNPVAYVNPFSSVSTEGTYYVLSETFPRTGITYNKYYLDCKDIVANGI